MLIILVTDSPAWAREWRRWLLIDYSLIGHFEQDLMEDGFEAVGLVRTEGVFYLEEAGDGAGAGEDEGWEF